MVVMVGIDVHKDTHCAVALKRRLARVVFTTLLNTDDAAAAPKPLAA
ncbi:MAG: hypothetical protein M3P91_05495 [Actinomycetota bacterium]|nr:hypothetical protein [Actinomycetota bacterium]